MSLATINDLELNEQLIRARERLYAASQAVMHGNNSAAFIALSEVETAVRRAQFRLNNLKFKEGT